MVENTNHIDYFDGNEKITQNEYKKLQELAKNPSTLEKLSKEQLQGLKDSLVSQLNGYKERSEVSDNSKKWIEILSNKIIKKIDSLLSKQETTDISPDTSKKESSESSNGVSPVQPVEAKDSVVNVSDNVEMELELDPNMGILEDLGINSDLLKGLTLSKIGQEHMKKVKQKLDEGKKEEAKQLAKQLLSDPNNFDDIVYENYKQKYEKAIKELESTPLRIDGSKLEGIDNLEASIISSLNDKIKNTTISVEKAGVKEEMSLSDYLVSLNKTVSITFENGKLTTKDINIDKKAISELGNIIRDTLPTNIPEKEIKLSLTFKEGIFSDSAEVSDIDAKSGVENIEAMVKDTLDLTKSKVFPKAPENNADRKDNVIYIDEIDSKKIYKVVVGEGETKIVKGETLKKYLESSYNSQIESKKAELKAQNEKELKASKDRVSKLVDSIDDLEVNETKANLEELGLIDLKIDGETPKVSKEGNKYTIDISGRDDLTVTKNKDNLTIRDEDNKLPLLKISSTEDVVKYNNLLQKYKLVEKDLSNNEEKLQKAKDALNRGDYVSLMSDKEKSRLIAENTIYINFKREVANISSVDQIDGVIRKLDTDLKELDKKESEERSFEENLDKVEDILGKVSFNKNDLFHYYNGGLFNKEEKEAINSWLGNFDKEISIHSVDTKVEGDKVLLKFDFNDSGFFDEKFDEDITIIVDKDKIQSLDQSRLSTFIKYNVIPQIAQLSQKGKDAWDDKSKKKFELK